MKVTTAQARQIVEAVALRNDVGINDLLSDYRGRGVVLARWEAYRALRDAGASYSRIGRLMQRDHSTVRHGLLRLAEAHR